MKPLIHLISPTCKVKPISMSEKLFNTYYQVHNLNELEQLLYEVVEKGNDVKREERLAAARGGWSRWKLCGKKHS